MPPANPLQMIFGALNMLGVRIFESPALEPKPKLKLSPACPVSDEFRAEMDAWLLEMFGAELNDHYIAVYTPRGILMAPSTLRALKSDNLTT